MPYQNDPAPDIREYTLVARPRLAGTDYVLATPDGDTITRTVKRMATPGYPQDPRTPTREEDVLGVTVLQMDSTEKVLSKIKEKLRILDHPARVTAEVRGTEYEWHVHNGEVELI